MQYLLRFTILLMFFSGIKSNLLSQENITQTIRGTVVDKETQTPLPGVNLVITTKRHHK